MESSWGLTREATDTWGGGGGGGLVGINMDSVHSNNRLLTYVYSLPERSILFCYFVVVRLCPCVWQHVVQHDKSCDTPSSYI